MTRKWPWTKFLPQIPDVEIVVVTVVVTVTPKNRPEYRMDVRIRCPRYLWLSSAFCDRLSLQLGTLVWPLSGHIRGA